VNDILDFSKVEAGQIDLERTPMDLATVVTSAVHALEVLAQQKSLHLEVIGLDELRDLVLIGDPARIRQILFNLVNNAIKFTSDGSVKVRTRIIRQTEKSATIRLEVADTGIGLSAQARERLFSPFSQADASTSRRYGGTGLGLSICKKLVELMDGDIDFVSQEGAGSTFWFTVTLPKSQPVFQTTPVQDTITSSESPGGRVLLVEDDIFNQFVAQKMLEASGFEVKVAADGKQALSALDNDKFDVVLMDCQMPVMDGFEATSRIRQSPHQAYWNIPVIALTANATNADREKCLACGMNDYLSKPIDMTTLVKTVTKWRHTRQSDRTAN
jgi:CheY-like chemotaxis protein